MWEENQYPLNAIYLHIPFCQKKCAYCDFYSVSGYSRECIERYVDAMRRWLLIKASFFQASRVESVFFGGGTPSLLEEREVASLLETISGAYHLESGAEISLEVNPATLSAEKARGFCRSGVNRISLGAQSFFSEELKTLGRLHSTGQIEETVALVRAAGFSNYSLDLIYGIPGQTIESWYGSLERARQCEPTHLSLYLLQLEEHTALARQIQAGFKTELGEDMEAHMYETGIDYLQGQGFGQYEISNFAVSGKECRHNLVYWKAQPYLGVGSGAVSFLGNTRFMMHADTEQFLEESEAAEILETMDSEALFTDALILGLRMREGVDLAQLAMHYRIDSLKPYLLRLEKLAQAGLVELAFPKAALTRQGLFLSNYVFRELL